MFDIGWLEMAVIAMIALIVVGPKDLPRVLRSVAHWARKARGLAREFQSGVDDMIREADLEDTKKAIDSAKRMDIDKILEDTVDPTGDVAAEVQSIEKAAKDDASDEKLDKAGNAKSADGADDTPQATIIKHPLQVAPPHSIKPPPPADEEESVPATGGDPSEKSA